MTAAKVTRLVPAGDNHGAGKSADSVRAIGRALRVLTAMNARPTWQLHELHLATALPKSTLSRILATLIELGYVRHEAQAGVYALTAQVQSLGAGYTQQSRLAEVGGPLLRALTDRIGWPLALGVLDRDAIIVRFSSMPYSPLAVHTTTLNYRLGIVDTAMGRVYLAFCAEAERTAITVELDTAGQSAGSSQERQMVEDIARIRTQGFAVRQPNAGRGSATLAVPIMADGVAIAVIGMTTFGRSLGQAVIDRHQPLLAALAQEIVAALAERETR